MTKIRVLVTYAWVRSSYAVIRNLSKHGYEVYVADSYRFGMGQSSMFHSGFDRYISHYDDEASFINDILRICHDRKIDFILPSHNETEILSKHRGLFSERLVSLIPNYDTTQLFNNKAKTYDLVGSLGLSIPRRIKYTSEANLRCQLIEHSMDKAVVKLLTGNGSHGVYYTNTVDETIEMVGRLKAEHALAKDRMPQVEEYVEGVGWGVSVLYWKGEKIYGFTHKRLREKIATGGSSTLRERASNKKIEAAAEAIFTSVNWHGVAMAEFKYCEKTKNYWFIEINPRLWGSLPLAISSGAEFPYWALLCAERDLITAQAEVSRSTIAQHWRGRWLLGDITVALRSLAIGNVKQAARILFASSCDSSDDFHLDDIFVFFGQILNYLEKGCYRLIGKRHKNNMIR